MQGTSLDRTTCNDKWNIHGGNTRTWVLQGVAISQGEIVSELKHRYELKISPEKSCSQDKLKTTGGMERVKPSPCD